MGQATSLKRAGAGLPLAMKAISGLMLVITATWALLLAETFTLFGVIRPLAPNIHESAFSAVLKVGAAIVLGTVWVVVMVMLRRFYVKSVEHRTHAQNLSGNSQTHREIAPPIEGHPPGN
jgi:hypothetical protein